MFQTSVEGGVVTYVDSPLLRAVKLGRVLVIDEVDKCSASVVAGLASLAKVGEMTLEDGRRILPRPGNSNDIVVHPNFRMILLANRPGFPFVSQFLSQTRPALLTPLSGLDSSEMVSVPLRTA